MDSKDKFIVIVLFIILGMWFTNQFKKAPKPGTQGTGTGTTQSDSTVQKTVGKNPENPENPKNQGTDTTKPVTLIAKPEINLLETFKDLKAAEKQTLKMNGLCDIIIDPEKGGIVDVSLKNYKSEDKLTNFHLGLEDYPMLALEGSLGEDGKGKLEFSHALILKSTDTELKIERQLKGTDLVIIQHWIIDYGYTIKYSVTIDNRGTSAIKVPKLQLNAGTMSPMDTPKGFFGAGGIDQRIQFLEIGEDGSDYEQIQKVQNFSGDKKELADEIKALHLTWLSIQNKFFLSILSNGDLTGSTFKTVKYGDEEDKRHVLIGYVSLKQELLNPKEKTIINYNYFLGPKKYSQLKDEPLEKVQTMGFGLFFVWHWGPMQFLSSKIYALISWLQSILGSYGLAIIITTVIIRTLFFPIIHRSNIFSQKMKKLQPEMKELNEKYGSDPMAKQEKIFELYRKHGMSPFTPITTGCLPMLLQIPVFFALFNVLRSAIELRHSGFLYIDDLSMPDAVFGLPIHPLALAMGLTMALHQKLMPQSPDPMQQKMMVFMTLMMVVFCYSLPSGLTLYWTTSNVCSIIQYQITQYWVKRTGGDDDDVNQNQNQKKPPKQEKQNNKKVTAQ